MTFVVEPPIGALNTALNTALTNMSGSSKVLLGIIVAGMMAVDMGGPFNKAAYVFGTASIAAGNYGIMAAVMIGGMVLRVRSLWHLFCLKINLQKQKENPLRQTLSWDLHLSQKVRFRLQHPIRCMSSRHALSVPDLQEHFPWHSTVR